MKSRQRILPSAPHPRVLGLALLLVAGAADAAAPTFNRDVAPIVFGECVVCHHPGGTAPFPLTNYAEVKKRAKQITEVTTERLMPPWLPTAGHGEFLGERRLTDEQIATLAAWVNGGTPQGAAADLKARPQWSDDWQLGKPDLVITTSEPYMLIAEGPDVYRNFVIRKPVGENRFLRAMEFRPGATGAVHHAFVLFDETGEPARRDARDAEPGFPGMDGGGAAGSSAMFTSWQPGRRPAEAPAGLNTPMRATTDIVLQLHMRPTGKPEKIQPSVALYFTAKAPDRTAFLLLLRSVKIDIPAGEKEYPIESSYTLPVDAQILAVLPHMHYLGKQAHAWAELPDGTKRDLIQIDRWNFDWQSDYRYRTPIDLPRGSKLNMRFTFDNSAGNERNPHTPPERVRYGVQSSDEMGEFWIQVLTRTEPDLQVLQADYIQNQGTPDLIARAKAMLERDPKDAESRSKLAAALYFTGRRVEALREARQATEDDPSLPLAHYTMAQIYVKQNDAPRGKAALEATLALNPDHAKAHNDLGWVLLVLGDIKGSIEHLERATVLSPGEVLPRQNLEKARAAAREKGIPLTR